jgi:hypothetical protein
MAFTGRPQDNNSSAPFNMLCAKSQRQEETWLTFQVFLQTCPKACSFFKHIPTFKVYIKQRTSCLPAVIQHVGVLARARGRAVTLRHTVLSESWPS